jgi:hypothetical protein
MFKKQQKKKNPQFIFFYYIYGKNYSISTWVTPSVFVGKVLGLSVEIKFLI